jgi:hypothetical protein
LSGYRFALRLKQDWALRVKLCGWWAIRIALG